MVKFFLREQMARLKVQAPMKKEQKKPVDYRLVIYKKMLNLVKAEHSIMIQKLIRKIKQKKQKNTTSEESNPQINKLNQKFTHLKSIKSENLRQIVIYIMTQVLKLQKMEKVFQKYKLSIDLTKLKQKTQSSESVKFFIQKLSMLTAYQNQLQKAASLVDTVVEKKVFRKEQLKERRIQKKIQKKINKQRIISEVNSKDQIKQLQIQIQDEDQKPFSQTKNKANQDKKQKKQNKFQRQNKFSKEKQIKKERTEFKKTGRNKVKQEKRQKRFGSYNPNKNKEPQENQSKSNSKTFSKNKELHPSWQAKKQLKNQMFIQPFQGKKILL